MAQTHIPKRPVGDSAEALYHQAIWDAIFGGKFPFVTTDKVRWVRGAAGYYPQVLPSRGGGPGGATLDLYACDPETGTIKHYRVTGTEIP